MTVQTPGSGAPQAGGAPAPQAGGAGSPSDSPQDGNRGQGQDPTQPNGQEPTGQQGQPGTDEGELPEPVREMLRNYRQENRSLRERLRAVEQGQQGQGQPQGDTIPRAELQRMEQQWQDRLRQQGVRSEVAMASAKLGVVDPEAAYRLLDTDDLDFDDKGQPTNVEAALKNLIRERPWLATPRAPRAGADGGAGGAAPRQGASMNDVLRAATGRGQRG